MASINPCHKCTTPLRPSEAPIIQGNLYLCQKCGNQGVVAENPCKTLGLSNNTITLEKVRAKQNVYDSSGTNTSLFNNKDASGENVKQGITTDETFMYSYLSSYANFINRELKKVNSVYKWKIRFLEATYFNRTEKIKEARENLSVGGSRFVFLGTCGYSPLESVALMKLEQVMDIDSLLVPKKNSNTLSKEDKVTGRPIKSVGATGTDTKK